MSNGHSFLVQRLRLCIVRGASGPWRPLLADLEELADSAFRSIAPPHQTGLVDEFRAWLPGWLITGQRLERAHLWLDLEVRKGTCPAEDEQERALRNYLHQTIHSGVGDFFRERGGRSKAARAHRRLPLDAADAQEARAERLPAEDREGLARVHQYLAGLPFALRVPFRLRFYEACGPLLPEELVWVAEQSGTPVEVVERQIQDELGRRAGAECPLSAEFIGRLLCIPPAADGRFTAVNQRVCRARQQLREQLDPQEEQP